jgi:hypothetical protein
MLRLISLGWKPVPGEPTLMLLDQMIWEPVTDHQLPMDLSTHAETCPMHPSQLPGSRICNCGAIPQLGETMKLVGLSRMEQVAIVDALNAASGKLRTYMWDEDRTRAAESVLRKLGRVS